MLPVFQFGLGSVESWRVKRVMKNKSQAASLVFAIKNLQKMAEQESDPALKSLWLRSAACGYDRLAKLKKKKSSSAQ